MVLRNAKKIKQSPIKCFILALTLLMVLASVFRGYLRSILKDKHFLDHDQDVEMTKTGCGYSDEHQLNF